VIPVSDVISAVSSEERLSLFKAIASLENSDSSILRKELSLTRKQFYSSMKKLVDSHLVKRTSGKYHLTSLGEIIFNMQTKVEIALKNHWKLKALDSIIKFTDNKDVTAQERQMIVDKLIDNNEIKAMLISRR
jgi:predicted transcriptional regulator